MPAGIAEMPATFDADVLTGMAFLGNFEFSIDQGNEVLNLKAPSTRRSGTGQLDGGAAVRIQ